MDDAGAKGNDPRRSLELLWRREPGRRGPKPRLSTDAVVGAAIAIADAEGLEAISMRRVADAVGLSPMSLYTYVPSKTELFDLMFDQAMGELAEPDAGLEGWRAKVAFNARQRWALVERRPWVLDLSLRRPPLGPNLLRQLEASLRAFDGMGLSGEDLRLAAETLHNYVNGAMQAARQAREAEAQSGVSDEEWLAIVGPFVEPLLDPATYPMLAAAAAARWRPKARTPEDRRRSFEFGLERLLDGLDDFVRGQARSSSSGGGGPKDRRRSARRAGVTSSVSTLRVDPPPPGEEDQGTC